MGGEGGFHKALTRKPLADYAYIEGASGSHEGLKPANMPWKIYAVCSSRAGIDWGLWVALQTTIDLNGLYDLLELKAVHASWEDAARRNLEDP